MIYTLTFNPALDYVIAIDALVQGMTNRTSSEEIYPGGKGFNVSIVLKNLGMETTALGFIAGFTGDEIRKRLEMQGVKTDLITLPKGASRINVKIGTPKEDQIETTEINGMGPEITKEDTRQLMQRLDALEEGDMLVLAGSVPKSVPSDIYESIIDRLKNRGIHMVVDAESQLLLKVLPMKPFLIKPNHHELGEIFGIRPESRESVIPYARKLREMGAQNVLVSMGAQGAVLITENNDIFMAEAIHGHAVNTVGAGDSMVAGFLAGWLRYGSYEEALKMALAAGSASAFSKGLAESEEILKLYRLQDKIERI